MKQYTTSSKALDPSRINTADDYELRAWANRFGVNIERLRKAVRAVGDGADAVERFLNRKSDATRSFCGD